jgi:hypothetical protein
LYSVRREQTKNSNITIFNNKTSVILSIALVFCIIYT